MPATLGQRLAKRDADRFAGRERELARVDALLADTDAPASVVLLHGPSGIGKSTLLREVARRAAPRGRRVHRVDGRDIGPGPGELDAALAGAHRDRRPVVLIDTYERITAAGAHLRRRILPSLPSGSLVLIAGRTEPEPEWFEDGWESVTTSIELGPLPPADALALVVRHGVRDDATARSLVAWADGSPLALAVGLDALDSHDGTTGPPSRETLHGRTDLARTHVRRIAGPELGDGDRDVLVVAAIARVCTTELLAAVLPDLDAARAQRWLYERSFTEPVGDGIAMHDLLRRALRAELRATAPEQEARLRRRIADHLYERSRTDGMAVLADLTELLDTEALRWGFGAEGSVTHRIDRPRDGDLDVIVGALEARVGRRVERSYVSAFLQHAPEHVVVARDGRDRLAGFCISATPDSPSAVVQSDPLLGRWLAHAREHSPGVAVLAWRDSLDLASAPSGDVHSPVIALMNTAAMLRCGLTNIQRSYLPIDPANPLALEFARHAGARHVPELDVEIGARTIQCHVLDHGEHGVVGQIRDAVRAEIAARPTSDGARGTVAGDEHPALSAVPAESNGRLPGADASTVTAADVRLALRRFHRPLDLARSPLAARDGTPAQRAAEVRAELERAVDEGFGDSIDERLLAETVRRGYFDPDGSHERAALELNVSRATYFRKLREACDRVADAVLARRAS